MTEQLREQLEAATRELKTHMASWEYAFAYGARTNDHPRTRPPEHAPESSGIGSKTSRRASPNTSCKEPDGRARLTGTSQPRGVASVPERH